MTHTDNSFHGFGKHFFFRQWLNSFARTRLRLLRTMTGIFSKPVALLSCNRYHKACALWVGKSSKGWFLLSNVELVKVHCEEICTIWWWWDNLMIMYNGRHLQFASIWELENCKNEDEIQIFFFSTLAYNYLLHFPVFSHNQF